MERRLLRDTRRKSRRKHSIEVPHGFSRNRSWMEQPNRKLDSQIFTSNSKRGAQFQNHPQDCVDIKQANSSRAEKVRRDTIIDHDLSAGPCRKVVFLAFEIFINCQFSNLRRWQSTRGQFDCSRRDLQTPDYLDLEISNLVKKQFQLNFVFHSNVPTYMLL